MHPEEKAAIASLRWWSGISPKELGHLGIRKPAHFLSDLRNKDYIIEAFLDIREIVGRKKMTRLFRIMLLKPERNLSDCFYCKKEIVQEGSIMGKQRLGHERFACHVCLGILEERKKDRKNKRALGRLAHEKAQLKLFESQS